MPKLWHASPKDLAWQCSKRGSEGSFSEALSTSHLHTGSLQPLGNVQHAQREHGCMLQPAAKAGSFGPSKKASRGIAENCEECTLSPSFGEQSARKEAQTG